MRTRNTSTTISTYSYTGGSKNRVTVSCSGVTTTGTVSLSSGSGIKEAVYERISDELGKGTSHPVIHRKKITKRGQPPVDLKYGVSLGGSNYALETVAGQGNFDYPNFQSTFDAYANWDVSSNTSVPPGWTIDLSAIDENVLKQDVIEKAKALRADALLNIVEANQFLPSLKSMAACLPKMRRQWDSIRKVLRYSREAGLNASGAYLAWKFGISPILSDLTSIYNYGPIIGRDMQRHADGQLERYSAVARGKWSFDNTPIIGGLVNGYPSHRYDPQGGTLSNPTVRYVLVVKPKHKWRSDLFKQLDFLCARFSSSPAELAWEKIPFSFVLDWFVDMRGVLNEVNTALGYSPWEVKSFTRSYSYHCWQSRPFNRFSPCGGVALPGFDVGSVECKHYERTLVSGLGSSLTWRPRFKESQLKVTLALIAQGVFKR
jgi:hypothetical protein